LHFKKIYQPVSRILFLASQEVIIYLAHTLLYGSCPRTAAGTVAAYPSASGEPPSNADLRGITAHKVYPIDALLQKPVSSYLTFSPLPQ